MVKYSVIIPIYNSEKTLGRCLKSLVSQGRDDVQIIAVNDGSTDSSEKIVMEFVSRYSGIDYIFQENAGVSRARNAGLDWAEGTYITFVDSDDYVAQDYFSVLDTADDSDLLVFAHENMGGLALEEETLFSELKNIESAEDRLAVLLASRKIMSPCNKRFKAELIRDKGVRFLPNMHTGEDFNFCMAYAVNCRSIAISASKILCVDISNQDSLSRKYRSALDVKLKTVFEQVTDTIRRSSLSNTQKMELLKITDYLFLKHVFSSIAEEFKVKPLSYVRDRRQIVSICKSFSTPFSNRYCNVIHFILRIMLKYRVYLPIYMVVYFIKGRKYQAS